METCTEGFLFQKFGSVYDVMDPQLRKTLNCTPKRIKARQNHSHFLRFDGDVYLELQGGAGILMVSLDPRAGQIEEFELQNHVHLKPNVYFAIASKTPELLLDLLVSRENSMDMIYLSMPYSLKAGLPCIQVMEILGYHYQIGTPNHRSCPACHPYFELIYVDTGCLHTEVDGKHYQLLEKEAIVYAPGQNHVQFTGKDQSASYVTISFEMRNTAETADRSWMGLLINKVFPYHRKTYKLIKLFAQESATGLPYTDQLMKGLLTELLIRWLQQDYLEPVSKGTSVVRQNYQDELFSRIVSYIESRIYEPLTVAEICQQFSLSRSSLQLLFKNAMNQSPKKFISDLKLEKSCQLLRENKYTISEIAMKLGYSSIHYFSNAFNQKYHVSPSEYAKRIY